MKVRTLDSLGFFPILPNEYLKRVWQEVLLLGKRTQVCPTPAHKLGRPRKEAIMNEELEYINDSSKGNNEADGSSNVSNQPTKYQCWFQPYFWDKIKTTLKLHNFKVCLALTYLKCRYWMPQSSFMFNGLNESIVHSWFESDGRTLRPRP